MAGKKIYLVCAGDGAVVDVLIRESYEEAEQETLARNIGEFLVEVDKRTARRIARLAERL